MKRSYLLLAIAAAAPALPGPPEKAKPTPQPPPPVSHVILPAETGGEQYIYEQKPVAGRPVLISPEQAQNLITRFKSTYPKLGSPRIAIYVNRELVDENSGLKLDRRTERSQVNSTDVTSDYKADPNAPTQEPAQLPNTSNLTIVGDVRGLNRPIPGSGKVNTRTQKTTAENTFKRTEKGQVSLADRQTVRDVERLFGRPLRLGGATLVDQRIATQLLQNSGGLKALSSEGEQARKDREALAKVADVALEVLISSRQINVTEISGEKTYMVPDIQATAIRLSDSKVLGQATASDIIGKDRYAGNIVRNFDVREIAEATALALMEDMLLGFEP